MADGIAAMASKGKRGVNDFISRESSSGVFEVGSVPA